MKPFDIELAKAGHPVQTRSGNLVRIICFDIIGERPIGAFVTFITSKGDKYESFHAYYENGAFNNNIENDLDLVMASAKKEGWVNIYKSFEGTLYCRNIYSSEEESINHTGSFEDTYIATTKIKWEE